jgi:hypothetical protein
MANKNPRLNDSGLPDPTAYEALKPIIKNDNDVDKTAHSLINTLKFIVDWAGFEFIGRIRVKHKKTGREFK